MDERTKVRFKILFSAEDKKIKEKGRVEHQESNR